MPTEPIRWCSIVLTVPTPADSVIAYPSRTGTPAAWKNSSTAGEIGAAPDRAIRSRPPKTPRTAAGGAPCSAVYSFSKIRGTDGSNVGRTCASSGTIARTSPPKYTSVAPASRLAYWVIWANTCACGRNRYTTSPATTLPNCSLIAHRVSQLRWVSTQPFGGPVVPEV